ncbi:lipopolysaccharide assembly protein LapA domain-containing protein [Nocardia huaxiensis]|uniref:DUF1049 domain-containing protein n=1 Tax=Nocardia huaxiensis TaxID=2755382 RepID=A0A7D6VHA4_9NOCA|nr:lipopolysaccharide assembly protein LapA domain-containing protein [Nocardia huaxiensis]QLY30056.1 DUF1049 domain-containing protein [Nocardia huaxiensis]UFS96345.1 lipopolysaccharide assembly protein LapA domain-containing protein [Nocardia huaxiensis]
MSSPEKPSLLSRVTPTQWIALALTVLAVLFIAANRKRVSIEFLLFDISSPLWLILLAMFVIGWLAGVLTARRRRNR